jgi:glycosyltransferase involved in cell wall biosynthesis
VRILAVTDSWFPDRAGGSGRVAAETAARLARRGHDVTVLAPRARERPSRTVDGSLSVLRTLPRGALPQTASDTWSTMRRAPGLGGNRFDVVVAHQVTNATGLALAGLGAPLVLVYHASAAREARIRGARPGHGGRSASSRALAPALAALERFAVARAARILVLSAYSASLASADHPGARERIRRVSGGVDTERFSPADGAAAARARLGLEQERPLLLVVRRLEPGLGIEDVLAAVRLLETPDLVVAIAGTGPLAGSLERHVERLGLGSTVRLLGAPSEERLADWYRAADAVVLPPAPHEGFGLATIEALASGTPVVASPAGATPELLSPLEPRLLARAAGPEALADAIRDTLGIAGPELRRRCRRYAVSRFAWDAVIAGWEHALEGASRSSERRPEPAAATLPAR